MANSSSGAHNPKSKSRNRVVSPARAAAFEILLKIAREKAFSAVLLPLYEAKLEQKDRALCHELVLGVLRRQIYLDRIIEEFSKKKPDKLDEAVLNSLRLGLYQLVFLDKIPAYSAINESVNLVYRARKNSAAGFVNAVLRRVTREGDFRFEFADEIERVSVETSHPRKLLERWTRQFGSKEAENIARADNRTGGVAFRLTRKANEKTLEILKKMGLEIAESEIAESGFRAATGSEMLRAFADDGKIYFQEESSQLVAETLNLQPGEDFLDVCAAPGGKTTLALQLASQRASRLETPVSKIEKTSPAESRSPKSKIENRIVAGDLREHRLRTLRETCAKTGEESIAIVAYDAETSLPFADESFDCILLDAPCSGTGTIRHNPEIRYFICESDFFILQKKQLRILSNASKLLKKGGRLIYSTCSLEREENEAVIEEFLQKNQDYRKSAIGLPEKFLTAEGFARTFPSRDDTDGFFIARLEKN